MGLVIDFSKKREAAATKALQEKITGLLGTAGHSAMTPSAGFTPDGTPISAQAQMPQSTPEGDSLLGPVQEGYQPGLMTPLHQTDKAATGLMSSDPQVYQRAFNEIAALNPAAANAITSGMDSRRGTWDQRNPTAAAGGGFKEAEWHYDPTTGAYTKFGIINGEYKKVPGSDRTTRPAELDKLPVTRLESGAIVQETPGGGLVVPQIAGAAAQPPVTEGSIPQRYMKAKPGLDAPKWDIKDYEDYQTTANETWIDIQSNAASRGDAASKMQGIADDLGALPSGFLGKGVQGFNRMKTAFPMLSDEELRESVAIRDRGLASLENQVIEMKNLGGKNRSPGAMTEKEWDIFRGSLPSLIATPEGRQKIAETFAEEARKATEFRDFTEVFLQGGGDMRSLKAAFIDSKQQQKTPTSEMTDQEILDSL